MFNYVKFKAGCWKCKTELKDFQTKDGYRELALEKITPKQIGEGSFYNMCPYCQAWNEYEVIPKEVEVIFNEKESKLRTINSKNKQYEKTNKYKAR